MWVQALRSRTQCVCLSAGGFRIEGGELRIMVEGLRIWDERLRIGDGGWGIRD